MFCVNLPAWLVTRIGELEMETGLTRGEIVLNALSSQIFPKQPARRSAGKIAASLLAICLLAAPVRAQTEQTDPPLDIKLKPPIVAPVSTLETPAILNGLTVTQPLVVRGSDGFTYGGVTLTPATVSTPDPGATLTPVTPAPATIAPKKPNALLRKCRFLCNFFAPFVNMAAAIKNFFN